MANTNAQGYRYQQKVSKYKLRHAELEKAYGPNWAEKYREDGKRIAAEKAALVEQEHQAVVAGAAPDEEPMGPAEFVEKELGLTGPAATAAVEFIHVVIPGSKPQDPGVLTSTNGPMVTIAFAPVVAPIDTGITGPACDGAAAKP